jgi:glycosyltransferase involved in cell wall biosynthesis
MRQTQRPRFSVSVVIPTYNRAQYIAEAVESALDQTRPADEIIVVDDGSTDDTAQVLARFCEPVRVVCQENRGRSAARNRGLEEARGDAIVFLDSDDLLAPGSLERRAAILESSPDVDVAYGDMFIIDGAGRRVGVHREYMPGDRPSGDIFAALALRCFILMPAMIRRTALEDLRFDESLAQCEDYDLWRRLAARSRYAWIDEPVGYYRLHGSNTVTQSQKILEVELEVQRRFFEMPRFAELSRCERARAYRYHGVKNNILGRTSLSRHYLALAATTAPESLSSHALLLANLVSPSALSWLVLRRRSKNRKALGSVAGGHDPTERNAAPKDDPTMP